MTDGRREKLLIRAAARMLAKAQRPIHVGVRVPVTPAVRALLLPGRILGTITKDAFGRWIYVATPPCASPPHGNAKGRET